MELVNRKVIITKALNREGAGRKLLQIAVISVLCFFIARVTVMDGVYPCGIVLITVLMNRNSLYLYILPGILLSLYTNHVMGAYIWGDFIATVACAAIFTLLGKRQLELGTRSLITVMTVIICVSGYHIAAGILYRFDLQRLMLEVCFILALIYVMDLCYKGFVVKERLKGNADEYLAALAAAVMLAACGIGIWGNGTGLTIHLPLILGLVITLYAVFFRGISAGMMIGGISGIILILCGGQAPGIAAVFICGGFVSGFFKGMGRLTAGVSFVAACLSLGLIREYPEMYMNIADPILAGALFLFLPKKLYKAGEGFIIRLEGEELYEQENLREGILEVLNRYRRSFEELSRAYGSNGMSRSIIAQQFRGMVQVVDKLEQEVREGVGTAEKTDSRHRIRVSVGESGYAGGNGVSGDSRLCKELSDGRFLMILSDGMGKGEAAAAESSRAVRTVAGLLEAGFEVEAALRVLNSIMLMKSEREIFTTIDIGIIDRAYSRVRLYKIGAATTFIKRKDKVVAVKHRSLPMGIVDGLDIDFVNVRLRPGDQIILTSDGITDSNRTDINQTWLKNQIEAIHSKDPQTMCDLIINRAIENYGLHEKDDLTVMTSLIC